MIHDPEGLALHHRPSSPPLSARVSGAVTRWSLLLRAALRRTLPARLGRFALGALVTTTVVGLVLAIPVISGVGAPAVELDSSSTTSPSRDGSSPVVMGMDGRPVSSADFAGVTTSGATPSSAAPRSSSETAVEAAPAEPADVAAPESGDAPAPESGDAPAPGTTAAAPAGTPATGGTTSGSPSPAAPRQPTSSAPAPAPAPPAAPAESPVEVADPVAEVLGLVNAERAAQGCGVLVADAGLAAAAQAHSAAMSGGGLLGLDGLIGAVAQGADATSVVGGWLADSSGAPLLDCSRTSAGIAVVDGWWTALVA